MKKLAILLLSVMAVVAAQAIVPTHYWSYAITDGGETVVTAVSPLLSGDVTVPSSFDGHSTTGIESGAFTGCEKITSIVVPTNIMNIGSGAFADDIVIFRVHRKNSTLPQDLQ